MLMMGFQYPMANHRMERPAAKAFAGAAVSAMKVAPVLLRTLNITMNGAHAPAVLGKSPLPLM
jgi:hypothetical protein